MLLRLNSSHSILYEHLALIALSARKLKARVNPVWVFPEADKAVVWLIQQIECEERCQFNQSDQEKE